MSGQFRYIGPSVSRSTLRELEHLREQAEKGELIGFAHVAIFRRREWSSGATGEAYRNKALTVGLMAIEIISLALDVIGWPIKDKDS